MTSRENFKHAMQDGVHGERASDVPEECTMCCAIDTDIRIIIGLLNLLLRDVRQLSEAIEGGAKS